MTGVHALVLAQVAATAGAQGPSPLLQFAPFILIIPLFYFLMIRPQQRRAREHQQRVGGIKRGDTVVLSSGLIGKVVRVEEAEIGVEIAQNVTVKVIKAMVAEVRARGEVAANDAKA